MATGCGREQQEKADDPVGQDQADVVLTPESVDPDAVRRAEQKASKSQARAVKLEGAGAKKIYDDGEGISPGAPTDDEVKADLKEARSELRKFKKLLSTTAYLQTGPRARVLKDGTAVAPEDAPEPVKRVIQAGNAISKLPYKWGGGHGAWRDTGYDCSGSVSFALAGAGLLRSPLASGPVHEVGRRRPGRVDHHLRQPRPHLHGGGGAALRHQRAGPGGHPLAGGVPRHERLRGAPFPRPVGPPCRVSL